MKVNIEHSDDKLYTKENVEIDDKDIIATDSTIATIVEPLLRKFKQDLQNHDYAGYPSELEDMEEWYELLDKMIYAFEYVQKGTTYGVTNDYPEADRSKLSKLIDKRHNKVKEGLNLFAEYFEHLWI